MAGHYFLLNFPERCDMKRMLKVTTYVQMLIALLVWTNSSLCRLQTYNIWPSINCFIQPCLTLEQFATSTFKNASAWIELSLSPGNHSLSSELLLENLSYLSLNAISDTEKTRITCNGSSQLSLFNISESQMNCNLLTPTQIQQLISNRKQRALLLLE